MRVLTVVSLTCIVLAKITVLVPPFALKRAVDVLSDNASRPRDKAVAPLFAVFAYFAGRTLTDFLSGARTVSYAVVSMENTKRFATDLFKHLQHLDVHYHMQRKTGELNRVMDRGSDSIDTIMNTVLFTLAPT